MAFSRMLEKLWVLEREYREGTNFANFSICIRFIRLFAQFVLKEIRTLRKSAICFRGMENPDFTCTRVRLKLLHGLLFPSQLRFTALPTGRS